MKRTLLTQHYGYHHLGTHKRVRMSATPGTKLLMKIRRNKYINNGIEERYIEDHDYRSHFYQLTTPGHQVK